MARVWLATLFVAIHSWRPSEVVVRVAEAIDRFRQAVAKLSPSELGIALPPLPPNAKESELKSLVKDVASILPQNVRAQLVSLDADSAALSSIPDVLRIDSKVYASVRCDSFEYIDRVAHTLLKFGGDCEPLARLSIVFGPWSSTPIIPAAAALHSIDSFAVALSYVDVLSEALRADPSKLYDFLRRIDEGIAAVERELGVSCLGVDLSLGPWLGQSVLALVEDLQSAKTCFPGLVEVFRALSTLVREVARRGCTRSTGLNTVVLSLSDPVLKQRVEEGCIQLRDLVYLAHYASAIDKLAVDRQSVDVASLLRDFLAIHRSVQKTLVVNLIPSIEREVEVLGARIPVLR